MKYLAILDFEHADMKALAKKGMEYEEIKKKDPDLWPGQFMDVYVMMKGWKAVVVWDATPEQIAHKVTSGISIAYTLGLGASPLKTYHIVKIIYGVGRIAA